MNGPALSVREDVCRAPDAGTVSATVPDAGVTDTGVPTVGPGNGMVARVLEHGGTALVPSPARTVTGPAVAVPGYVVPADEPGQRALISDVIQQDGLPGAYRVLNALDAELHRTERAITGAETFAQQVDEHGTAPGGVPWGPETFAGERTRRDQVEATRRGIASRIEEVLARWQDFRRKVITATVVRLDGNRAALLEWTAFVRDQLTADQLRRQVVAERERSLITRAVTGPRPGMALEALERRAGSTSAVGRRVEERVATGEIGGGCQYCHEVQGAHNQEYAHPERPQGEAPLAALLRFAEAERADTTPVPGFLDERPDVCLPRMPSGLPQVAREMAAIEVIRPVLRLLGDDGYKVVLPDALDPAMSDEELLAAVEAAIERRRADLAAFAREVQAPGFDYTLPRPVLRTLLPLADPDVRRLVELELAAREADEAIGALVRGAVTVAALLLTIIPPTAPLGIALDIGLAGYGVVEGFQTFEQGRMLSLGIGSTVLDPEQLEAAEELMAIGALDIVMNTFGIAATTLQAVKMVRLGTGRDAVLEAVEGRTAGRTIRVTDLNTSTPRVTVTSAEGEVVEATLDELARPGAYTSRKQLVKAARVDPEAGQTLSWYDNRTTSQLQQLESRGDVIAAGELDARYGGKRRPFMPQQRPDPARQQALREELAASAAREDAFRRQAEAAGRKMERTAAPDWTRGVPTGKQLARRPGTLGVAQSDVAELDGRTLRAASPKVDSDWVPSRDFTPANPVSVHHAEEDLAEQIHDALSSLSPEQLARARGRTVWIRVDQEVCSSCGAGLANASARHGVLLQLSEKWPDILFEITADDVDTVIRLLGGKVLP